MTDFQALYARPLEVVATASGRVNLIGEHTDYNGGFVLPTLIPQGTQVSLSPRDDDTAQVASDPGSGALERATFTIGDESRGRGWLDFVQGVTRLLRGEGFAVRGFDALITSTLPTGIGLSSSAALSVSLMRALRAVFDLDLDDTQLALFGQRVENEFIGARVGIMDPMVISLAPRGTALFLDCRDLTHELVPMPASADLVVINSGVSHQISADSEGGFDYNTRHAECEQACALLGIEQLRDIDMDQLPRLDALPERLRRRARHVVTENDRVLAAVDALRAGDLPHLGELFYASHASMRDDYEVSVPEIDLMVELARADGDAYGARLTGGGFGGSVVLLARQGSGRAVARRIVHEYGSRSGRTASILVPAP